MDLEEIFHTICGVIACGIMLFILLNVLMIFTVPFSGK